MMEAEEKLKEVGKNLRKIQVHLKTLTELEEETKNTEIPRDWFWHKDCLEKVEELRKHILKEIKELRKESRYIRLDFRKEHTIDDLARNLSHLAETLKEVKERHFHLKEVPEKGQEINMALHNLDSHLTTLMKEFQFLEKNYGDDPFLEKKKILIQLGFNIFRYPVVTRFLLADWGIIKEMNGIFGGSKGSFATERFHYTWMTIPLFFDLIFSGLSEEEAQPQIEALKKKYQRGRTPEEIYQDPNFLSDLKQFLGESAMVKIKPTETQKAANLRYCLLILAVIIKGGTMGEHLGRHVVGTYIPNLRKNIKNQQDLVFIYDILSQAEKLYPLLPMLLSEALYRIEGDMLKNFGEFNWKKILKDIFEAVKKEKRWSDFDRLVGSIIHGYEIAFQELESVPYQKIMEDIPQMVRMARGSDMQEMFMSGFKALNAPLENKALKWKDVVEYLPELSVKTKRYPYHHTVFREGLPLVIPLLADKKLTWEEMVKDLSLICRRVGKKKAEFFFKGLSTIGLLIWQGKISWKKGVMVDLIKLIKKAGPAGSSLFGTVIPEYFHFTQGKKISWKKFTQDLSEMAQQAGDGAEGLFASGMRVVKELIGDEKEIMKNKKVITWDEAVRDLPRIARAAGGRSEYFFNTGISRIRDIIDRESWPDFVNFFCYVGSSKQKTEQMVEILSSFDLKAKPFFLYLIQVRPKQALDILNHYRILQILRIDFKKELDLFLKIASPIVQKGEDFRFLARIILPIKDISPAVRRRLLGFLNLSLGTFQGVKLNFLESLQATEGFEKLDDYSFADLVYVYLKYAQKPGFKLKKLQKALAKLQKAERNCLNLISGKKGVGELNEMEAERLRSNILSINEAFFEPVLGLFKESTKDKIKKELEEMFKVKIKDVEVKAANPSFHNALVILDRLEGNSIYQPCFNLIQQYLAGDTYPNVKNIKKSYPFTLLPNQRWMKKHLQNDWWFKNFRKEYKSSLGDVQKTNVEDRIKHHLEQSEGILKKLKIEVEELDLKKLEAAYKEIAKDKSKYDEVLVSDLKTQIDALKSLVGQEKAAEKSGQKIIIQPEFDPLEVFQMGNYVSGSCLATAGCNYWSTVTNAIDANKRVLWAKDAGGEILGRLLIAVDEDNNLVRFRVYYATNLSLDKYFDDYLTELAERCGFGINGNAGNVKQINTENWYIDPVYIIGEGRIVGKARTAA